MMQQRGPRRVSRGHQVTVGGDERGNGRPGAGAHGRDQRGQAGVDGLGWCFLGHVVPEIRTLVDPGPQHADLLRQQRARWWHLHAAIAVHQSTDQLALAALAGHDDRPVVAASKRVLPQIEAQARLLHLGAVAGVAVLRQQWLHVLDVVHRRRGRGRTRRLCRQRHQQKRRDQHHQQRLLHCSSSKRNRICELRSPPIHGLAAIGVMMFAARSQVPPWRTCTMVWRSRGCPADTAGMRVVTARSP